METKPDLRFRLQQDLDSEWLPWFQSWKEIEIMDGETEPQKSGS